MSAPSAKHPPLVFPGMRIGLMGGSFDPAHEGHRHCAKVAMKRLGLHQVWWLVSPQNPLKPKSAPFAQRLAGAAATARDPKIVVTGFEAAAGLQFTVETLQYLRARANGARFIWVMGADAMVDFHRWRRWRSIAAHIPIAIAPRPGAGAKASASKAFACLRARRVDPGGLHSARLPAWTRLGGPVKPHASTAIRAARFQAASSRGTGSQP